MKCPNCNETLTMSDRNGVEIDYCPKCRGVWLDRGELDKIIERSDTYMDDDKGYNRPKDHEYGRDDRNHRHKKKRSFLGDFFDFD